MLCLHFKSSCIYFNVLKDDCNDCFSITIKKAVINSFYHITRLLKQQQPYDNKQFAIWKYIVSQSQLDFTGSIISPCYLLFHYAVSGLEQYSFCYPLLTYSLASHMISFEKVSIQFISFFICHRIN